MDKTSAETCIIIQNICAAHCMQRKQHNGKMFKSASDSGTKASPHSAEWNHFYANFNHIFLNESHCMIIQISLKFDSKGSTDNKSPLVQVTS